MPSVHLHRSGGHTARHYRTRYPPLPPCSSYSSVRDTWHTPMHPLRQPSAPGLGPAEPQPNLSTARLSAVFCLCCRLRVSHRYSVPAPDPQTVGDTYASMASNPDAKNHRRFPSSVRCKLIVRRGHDDGPRKNRLASYVANRCHFHGAYADHI